MMMTPDSMLLKAAIFAPLLETTAFLGSIFILIPFFPLIFYRPKLWRFCADQLVAMWLTLPPALLEFLYGIQYFVSGDRIIYDQPALILMNHRTRLDWLFFWSVLYKMDPRLLTTEKISLKKELKRVPGAGWAMECDSFIFLDRNWEADQKVIDDTVHYYASSERNYQILLFPEGTDKCANATQRSHKYADKMGLPRYEHVLHPRTTGFTYLAKKMKQAGYLRYIYDVNMGYADRIIQSETEMATKGPPQYVHCHIQRYDVDDLPIEDETKMENWLQTLWEEKERRLERFHAEPDPLKRHFPTTNKHLFWPVHSTGVQRLGLMFSIIMWLFTAVMWLYFFVTLTPTFYYILFAIGVFVYLDLCHGGVERFVIERFKIDEQQRTSSQQLNHNNNNKVNKD